MGILFSEPEFVYFGASANTKTVSKGKFSPISHVFSYMLGSSSVTEGSAVNSFYFEFRTKKNTLENVSAELKRLQTFKKLFFHTFYGGIFEMKAIAFLLFHM